MKAGGHADSCIEIVLLQADRTSSVVAPMFGGYHCLRHQQVEMTDIELQVLLFLLLLSPRPPFAVNKHNEEDGSSHQKATSHVAKYQENSRTAGLHGVTIREIKRRRDTRVAYVDQ